MTAREPGCICSGTCDAPASDACHPGCGPCWGDEYDPADAAPPMTVVELPVGDIPTYTAQEGQ